MSLFVVYILYFLKKIKATIQKKICATLKMMQLPALLNAMAIDNLFSNGTYDDGTNNTCVDCHYTWFILFIIKLIKYFSP